ncbi:hypothetical protein [Vampirovibrio sp.]|uniref:hypothetical protein n=1 Tax=Vampirovibrio sp. TaxID=2717857 RepID=UPI00359333C5
MPSPSEPEILSKLAAEIVAGTALYQADETFEDVLPTAADLARKLNYRLETVKKKLRVLKDHHLIQSVGMTPKRYRFNRWALKELEPDSPLFELFCDPESPAFIQPDPHHRIYR